MTIIDRKSRLKALLTLSRELGDPRRPLAILAEGNTSVKISDRRLMVKASGSVMARLTAKEVVECASEPLLALIESGRCDDTEVQAVLLDSRVDRDAPKPSVECLFHAWLLSLPGVEFVGHAHPCAATGILSSAHAGDLATKRICPDEVVCCDVASVLVPYVDPGLPLAREIKVRTLAFQKKHRRPPRVILLENHGIITLGGTPEAVLAAMLMTEKSATIRIAAAGLGGSRFMSPKDVSRISSRADEAIRRKALRI